MKFSYYHKNIHSLGDATKEYIEERMGTLADIRKIDMIRIEIDQEKNGIFHMSAQVNCGAKVYYASTKNEDVNVCADDLRGELRQQMQRQKGKVRDLVRRGARSLKKKLTISDDARL